VGAALRTPFPDDHKIKPMSSQNGVLTPAVVAVAEAESDSLMETRRGGARAERVLITIAAIAAGFLIFSGFLLLATKAHPVAVFESIYRAGFGSWFSLQKTLIRAAPLLLTALCVAIPAQLGLIIIGGEGALVMGGLAAAITGFKMNGAYPMALMLAMAIAAMIVGGAWIAFCGALKQYRGVNETISSLLLTYIAIALLNHAVSGPFRDPQSLNKPSTPPIGEINMLGTLPGLNVHVGLLFGLVACVIAAFVIYRTVPGFAMRVTGGNVRAAQLAGLPVGKIIIVACFYAGAAAGLAGMVEVAAVHGSASASINAGYGYTGILIAFIARQHPLAIIPSALLLAGIGTSSGLLQRVHGLPDATVPVMQGIMFLTILASETLYGRRWRKP
jgi:general nucleoside transport system permease protein